MTDTLPNSTASDDGAALVCSKCGYENPPDAHHCRDCGAHLVIRCHACGHRNERTESHCVHCGHHLHRSLWGRLRKKAFLSNSKIAPWQIVLLVLGVLLGFLLILFFAELRLKPLL